ncbi:SET domain-containing protein [Bradyrhizobium sp. USDA 223]|uniref:SET domain-containing protein n=1 Tax=Bradyrhizobium sp. USDA 223 TaxID=3156306 RepID=UPI00384B1A9E
MSIQDNKANDSIIEYNTDNARFVNNNIKPNTYQRDHCRCLTARHVQPGEELTYDYLLFDLTCDLSRNKRTICECCAQRARREWIEFAV